MDRTPRNQRPTPSLFIARVLLYESIFVTLILRAEDLVLFEPRI
ncbi:MAG: hypothetical protein ACREBQ_07980 [Nitrososphaerales archaeon]